MASHPNRVLAIVVAAIAAIAIVAAVFSATRTVPEHDRGTPEGTVQEYVSAVVEGDNQRAIALLAAGAACTVDDLDRAHHPDDVRVVLRDTHIDGDTARVGVDVVISTGGPFDGSEYDEEHTFRLTRANGEWRITGEPWPMFACTKGG